MTPKDKKQKSQVKKLYLVFTELVVGDTLNFIAVKDDYKEAEDFAVDYTHREDENTCILTVTAMTNVLVPDDPIPTIEENVDLKTLLSD